MRKNLKKVIKNKPSLCSDFAGYRETGLSQGDFMRKPRYPLHNLPLPHIFCQTSHMRHLLLLPVLLLTLLVGNPAFSADFQKGMDAAQKGDFATALKEWKPLAEEGNANAQYNLGLMYEDGQGVPQDDKTAMKWYRLAAKQGNSDAQQRYGELVLQDIVYGSDVRALEDLGKYVETFCQRNFKCAFDKIWAYLDITGDGRLSLAEIARFQRNILKFGVLSQKEKVLSQKEKNDMTGNIVAINLASIIFLPITASSVLHSFDYNNDGLLSKGEVFGETEFAKLVGLDADTLMGGVNFETLSKQLQEIRDLIPFPFPK